MQNAIMCWGCRSDSGAVTVDWVVLTAAAVGLAIAAIASVGSGALAIGEALSSGSVTAINNADGDG